MIVPTIEDVLAAGGGPIDYSRAARDAKAPECPHCSERRRWCVDRATGTRILISVGTRYGAIAHVDPADLPHGAVAVFDNDECVLLTADIRERWASNWRRLQRSYVYRVHWETCAGSRRDRDASRRTTTLRARVEDVPAALPVSDPRPEQLPALVDA